MTAKKNQLRKARDALREIKGDMYRARQAGTQDPAQSNRKKLLQLNHVITLLQTELNTYDEDGKPIALAMGVTDSATIADAQLLVRGEVALPKDRVPRGFLQVLSDKDAMKPLADDSSGRFELARWIASAENPLTARVMVNRIWMHLMGSGIVTSVDNFGARRLTPNCSTILPCSS